VWILFTSEYRCSEKTSSRSL